MTMRAKMQVNKVEKNGEPTTSISLSMAPVTSRPFDPDGVSEDNSYSRWTPSGALSLSITNPNLFGKFTVGQKFYVDFMEAQEDK